MPTTPATILAWAEIWLRLSVDKELLSGPLTDDGLARDRYGRSARQLRRLRQAVLSGALRRQAEQLGVDLPVGYVDLPSIRSANGRSVRRRRRITHHFAMGEFMQAYDVFARAGETGALKVVLSR